MPRCFDPLVLLIERRSEAVSKRNIIDTVWNDVVVTDGALSQAVRILGRTLGDERREPTFIRMVQRHGYRVLCDQLYVRLAMDYWARSTIVAAADTVNPVKGCDESGFQ